MVVLLRYVLDAVTFYVWDLDYITPFAANDAEFTGAFMGSKVLLEHLGLTAKDGTLDRCILALILMTFKVVV